MAASVATVYLALGSNLGNRVGNIRAAIAALEAAGVHVATQSSLYETEPQDVTDQPWFVNAAIGCEVSVSPFELLAVIREIEARLGRDRSSAAVPKGPRIIDIDVLLFGDIVLDTPELTIPHPRMWERRFVLEPLREIVANASEPRTGQPLASYLVNLEGQVVRKLSGKPL